MSNVRFELNSGWDKALARQIADNVSKKLSSVSCPTHGGRPEVVVKGRGLDDLRFEVHGCCEDLVQRSLKQLQ